MFVVVFGGFGVLLLFLLTNAFLVGLQFFIGVGGLIQFIWAEKLPPSKVFSVRETRRTGILMWLWLAGSVLVFHY
jgi:hypothetical protein